jgi:hypothetical protein
MQIAFYLEHCREDTTCEALRHIQEDNNKMNSRETGYENVVYVNLAPDRGQWKALVNTINNLQIP